MGVLQNFERRLEGLVEGAFAAVSKAEVQPVELASGVQREMDERAAIVAQGRTLVPNDFVVELAHSDHERLAVYSGSIGEELSKLARDYASEQGYSFVGPVKVRLELGDDLKTGRFRIRSGVIRGTTVEADELRQPPTDYPRSSESTFRGQPRLLVTSQGRSGDPFALENQVTLLGRSTDCDLRLVDNGVSRHHAEIRMEEGDEFFLVDLGSTNGSYVNDRQVRRAALVDGARLALGDTRMTFRRD